MTITKSWSQTLFHNHDHYIHQFRNELDFYLIISPRILVLYCVQIYTVHRAWVTAYHETQNIMFCRISILSVPLSRWPAESPVKRKRGRPKGSTKKARTDLTEGKADSTRSPEDHVQRKERNKEEGDRQCSSIEGKYWCHLYVSHNSFFFMQKTG